MDFLDQHLCVYALFEYITIFITINIDQLKGTSSLCKVQSGGWSPWVLYLSGATVTYLWKKKQDVFIVPNFSKINTSSTVHWRLERRFWNVRHLFEWISSFSSTYLLWVFMCLHLLIVLCCLLYSVVSGLKNSHPCYAMFGCIQKIEGKGKERYCPFLCLVSWEKKGTKKGSVSFYIWIGERKERGLLTFTWFYFYAFKGQKCGSK